MKKLFSFLFVGLLSLFLLGCEADELERLQEQISALESEMDLVSQENESLSEALALSSIENNRVTFVIEASDRIIETVAYNASKTAFDLLLDAIGEENIMYSESEFGIFISALYDLAPEYGSYIMISKNDVPIEVGISSVSFEVGDVFTFESVYWDRDVKVLDEAMYAFMSSDTSEFLDPMSYEYLTALAALNQVPNLTYESSVSTENDLIKTILIKRALNESTLEEQSSLGESLVIDSIFADGLAVMALSGSSYYETALSSYEAFVQNQDPDNLSFDEVAMVALVLAENTLEDYQEALLEDVFLMTNAPSLAYGIMGLIAIGENPYELEHTIHDNIVEALLHLQAIDGGFLYTYDSSPSFMRTFSSPQSFLALVTLKAFLNGTPLNPYLIP